MFIDNYDVPDQDRKYLRVGNTAEVLREPRVSSAEAHRLVVWRDAMRDPVIDEGMRGPDWAAKVLVSLASVPAWTWEAKQHEDDTKITDRNEIIKLAASASGIDSAPNGNLIVILNLRDYQDKASDIGSYTWWQEENSKLQFSDPFVKAVFSKTADMLTKANNVGADFYVEQLAVIVSKDPSVKTATLTPTLHSDEFYGFRETALFSLLERGYNPYGGTIFVPSVKMREIEQHRPIDMKKLMELLPNTPLVKAGSGDLMLYDGMIGTDGVVSMSNGIPHISTDLPGLSSRLVMLMRNKQVPAPK